MVCQLPYGQPIHDLLLFFFIVKGQECSISLQRATDHQRHKGVSGITNLTHILLNVVIRLF